jgi:hypothetical protein
MEYVNTKIFHAFPKSFLLFHVLRTLLLFIEEGRGERKNKDGRVVLQVNSRFHGKSC